MNISEGRVRRPCPWPASRKMEKAALRFFSSSSVAICSVPPPTNHLLYSLSFNSSSASAASSSSSRLGLCRRSGHLPASSSSKRLGRLKMDAVASENGGGTKWWERNAGPNMVDIHSTQEFIDALQDAGDKLVIVEFYGTWCASCRALFPRLCRLVAEHSDLLFLKVNFDENKPMCKRLNVRVLPYFQFYRGADGLLEAFSCNLAKFQKLKDAVAMHNTARCSIGPPAGVSVNLLGTSSSSESPPDGTSP